MTTENQKGKIDYLPAPPNNMKGWPWTEENAPTQYASNKNWPRLSIVTPTYNQGEYIEKTIRSVLLQNYPNLEYIIIDGGSTDDTLEIIKKYSNWISFWVSEKDDGQSHAINKGLKKITGDVFNWINSDDYYEPNALYNIAKNFIDSDSLIVSGGIRKFGNGFKDTFLPVGSLTQHSFWGLSICQPSTFIHTSALKEVGEINVSLKYRMDLELLYRFVLRFGVNRIKQIDILIVSALYHENAKTVSSTVHFLKETNSILHDISNLLNLKFPNFIKISESIKSNKYVSSKWFLGDKTIDKNLLSALFDEYFSHYIKDSSYIYRQAGHYLLSQGGKKSSLRFYCQAVKESPFKLINYKCLVHALKSHFNK